MKTTKKTYQQPATAVVEIEPEQMVCTSQVEYSRRSADDVESYTGEFD